MSGRTVYIVFGNVCFVLCGAAVGAGLYFLAVVLAFMGLLYWNEWSSQP
jgi:hypothetical protein